MNYEQPTSSMATTWAEKQWWRDTQRFQWGSVRESIMAATEMRASH